MEIKREPLVDRATSILLSTVTVMLVHGCTCMCKHTQKHTHTYTPAWMKMPPACSSLRLLHLSARPSTKRKAQNKQTIATLHQQHIKKKTNLYTKIQHSFEKNLSGGGEFLIQNIIYSFTSMQVKYLTQLRMLSLYKIKPIHTHLHFVIC